jgi:putative flippase GtrA
MILTKPQERTRFLKFLVVGTMGAVVDFGIFNLVTRLTPIPAVVASGISFVAAIFSNFFWNRFWTYPDSRSKPFGSQLAQFFLISGMGLVIRIPLFAVLENPMISLARAYLPARFFLTPVSAGHNIALAIVVLIVMLWNFFANRLWTYNDVK